MSAEAERRITRLEQKFKSLERAVTSLEIYLGGEAQDAVNAGLRLASLTGIFNEYVHNHEELSSLRIDHPHVAKFDKLEARYFDVAAMVHKLKTSPPNPLANSTSIGGAYTLTERVDMPKLAPIQVPKFDGSSENWVTWKASFQALIHDRPGMAGSVKLSQLKAVVQGLAAMVIEEFKPTDENYALAWDALCKAYDQRRIIVNEHFDALLNLSPSPKPTAETTAKVMYIVRQHVSMLKAMNIQIGDEFVVRIIERCLPGWVLSRWVDRQSSTELSKLEDLYAFIQDAVFKQREMDKLPQRGYPAKRPGSSNVGLPSKVAKSTARSFVTPTVSKLICPQCGRPHQLYKCDTFNKSQMKEKWDLVRDKKLCRNCLGTHSSSCASNSRCKKCQGEHHTLLHTDKRVHVSNVSKSQPVKEAKSSGPSQI